MWGPATVLVAGTESPKGLTRGDRLSNGPTVDTCSAQVSVKRVERFTVRRHVTQDDNASIVLIVVAIFTGVNFAGKRRENVGASKCE